jgi:hypothetical protein
MCPQFMFFLITRAASWLRLSRREETWKTAEILILRHQLTVLQRQQARRPKLNWADRALLAALFGGIPKARRRGLRLLITPGHDPALAPRHRPPPGRQVHARQHRPTGDPPEHQGPGPPAGPGKSRVGVPQNPRRAGRLRSEGRSVHRMGDPQGQRHRPRAAAGRADLSQFLRSQAEAILACDFFTADLLDGTQAYVLTVIGHASRRIRILGVTPHPTGEWTTQQARNLIMDLGEQAHRIKFMIRDRGSNFTAEFDAALADAGIRTVLCNVATPRMNAIAERWIGGCRRELLDRTLVWNQNHLRQILREYETHHNQHPPHRSLNAAAPLKPLPEPVDHERYRVRRRTRASGTINEYRLAG